MTITDERARAANCDNKMIIGREPATTNGRESIGKKGRTFRWSRTKPRVGFFYLFADAGTYRRVIYVENGWDMHARRG